MSKLDSRTWPLATRLIITITALIALVVSSITVLSIRREQSTFQSELEEQAILLLETIDEVSANPLYNLDVDFLEEIVQELDETNLITSARIYDADGRLIADSESGGQLLFGLEPNPFGEQLIESESRIFDWQPGHLLAGQQVTVGRQVVGALSVSLPTAPLDAKMAATRNEGLTVAVIGIVVSMGLALLFSRTITNPLTRLTETTRQIAEGNLSQRIAIQSGGEVAVLAESFNDMADKLQKSMKTLEQRAEELQIANQKAIEASQLKSEFLSIMSHELRTPLNAIIGYAGIMLEGIGGEIDDDAQGMVSSINDSSKHLLGLINDILDLSKIEAGRMELVDEPFEVRPMINNIKQQMGVLPGKKGLAFNVDVKPEVPAVLRGDMERISQIVINLLSNGFKFAEQGAVGLNLKWLDDQLSIVVSDTGIGIPPHALQYIFEEFRQVDGTASRVYEGTGLGLPIVKKLAEVMGGRVMVESKMGEGTTFTVRLPLKPVLETETI